MAVKKTVSSKQGRTMLRNKGHKFAGDAIYMEDVLMKALEKAKEANDLELVLSIIRLNKDLIGEVWPYIWPKMQAIAHGIDSEKAEELLKILREVGSGVATDEPHQSED